MKCISTPYRITFILSNKLDHFVGDDTFITYYRSFPHNNKTECNIRKRAVVTDNGFILVLLLLRWSHYTNINVKYSIE